MRLFRVDDEGFEEIIEVGASTRVDVLVRIDGNKGVEGAIEALKGLFGVVEGQGACGLRQ